MSLLVIITFIYVVALGLAGLNLWNQGGTKNQFFALLCVSAGVLVLSVSMGWYDLHAAVHPAVVHHRH
jgi:hypothetical protein